MPLKISGGNVYPTVDAIIKKDQEILLVKKNNEDKWRFIGGFIDNTDNSAEDAILREIKEEVSVNFEYKNLKYIGSSLIDDWRYKGNEKIMTFIFSVEMAPDINKYEFYAKDDIIDWKWFNIPQIECNLVEEHKIIWNKYKDKFGIKN